MGFGDMWPHAKINDGEGTTDPPDEGDFEVLPRTSGDLSTIGQADAVVLGVKAHSLSALAPERGAP